MPSCTFLQPKEDLKICVGASTNMVGIICPFRLDWVNSKLGVVRVGAAPTALHVHVNRVKTKAGTFIFKCMPVHKKCLEIIYQVVLELETYDHTMSNGNFKLSVA